MTPLEARTIYHDEQYKYCRSCSRPDGFIYCDDCFFGDACCNSAPGRSVEYCWLFRFAPKEVQQ